MVTNFILCCTNPHIPRIAPIPVVQRAAYSGVQQMELKSVRPQRQTDESAESLVILLEIF